MEGSFLVPELNGTVCPVRFRLRVLGRLDIISLDGCDDLNVRFLDGGELCQARSSDPERDDVHDEHAEECNDADSKLCEASVNVVGARSPPHRIGVVVPGVVDASAELLCVRELEVTRLQEMHEASREDDPTPKKPGGTLSHFLELFWDDSLGKFEEGRVGASTEGRDAFGENWEEGTD